MGQKTSQLKLTDIYQLKNETLFTEGEIRDFHKDFLKNYPSGKMTKEDLRKLYKKVFPQGDSGLLVEQIFRIYDSDKNDAVDFREFLCVISVISNGPSDAKLKMAFDLYDQDRSGYITKDEFQSILMGIHKAFGAMTAGHTEQDGCQEKVESFERMDSDRDDRVTLDEFREYSKRDPTLISLMRVAGGR